MPANPHKMSRNIVTATSEGVTILYTHPLTVEFLTRHDNSYVGDMAVKNMDCWVDCMHRCMTTNSTHQHSSDVMAMMLAVEKRYHLAMHDLHEKIEEKGNAVMVKSLEVGDSLQNVICSQMQSSFTTLASNVEAAVMKSVERFDVTAMSAMMAGSVREYLKVEHDGLKEGFKEGHQVTLAGVRELEGRLHNIVVNMVSTPQNLRHEHLMTVLGGLPAQVSQMCAKATSDAESGKDIESRVSLSEKIVEMRVRLDEVMAMHSREHLVNRSSVSQVTLNVQQVIANMVEQKSNASLQMTHVPVLIKAAFNETFKDLESQSEQTNSLVYNIQKQLNAMSGALQVLLTGSTDMTRRVDNLAQQVVTSQVKQANSNSAKGIKGEYIARVAL